MLPDPARANPIVVTARCHGTATACAAGPRQFAVTGNIPKPCPDPEANRSGGIPGRPDGFGRPASLVGKAAKRSRAPCRVSPLSG